MAIAVARTGADLSRCIYLYVPEYGRRPPFPLNSAGCAAKTLLNVVFEEGSGRRIGDHQAGQAILWRCIIEDSNGNVSQVEMVLKDQNSIRRESEGTQDSETAWGVTLRASLEVFCTGFRLSQVSSLLVG